MNSVRNSRYPNFLINSQMLLKLINVVIKHIVVSLSLYMALVFKNGIFLKAEVHFCRDKWTFTIQVYNPVHVHSQNLYLPFILYCMVKVRKIYY